MADLLDDLHAAAAGLLYPSESDEPFEVVAWPAAAGSAHDAVAAHAGGEPIEEISVDEFFADLADSDDAARFTALRRQLEKLEGLTVLRVGRVEVDIYLIGRLPDGWAGVKARSIET